MKRFSLLLLPVLLLLTACGPDTPEELNEMADKIGVARKWIQASKSGIVHFDICQSKKKLAIEEGAISVTAQDVILKKLYFKNDA